MVFLTGYWGLDAVILMIAGISALYAYMAWKFLYWKKRGVMQIPPTAFTGNFGDCLFMRRSPGQFVKDLYDQAANLPYMGFYILDKPFFLVRDPELMKNMLVRDFSHFADRYAQPGSNDSLGVPNLFFLKNPAWKIVRTKLTPIFTSGKLKRMFELMLEVGDDLDTYLKSLDVRGEGRSLDMKELCAKYTTDIIGTTAYGLKVNSLNNPDAEFRTSGRDIFTFNTYRSVEVTSLFFAPQFVGPLGFKFFSKKNEKFLRSAFWDTIVEREKSGTKRGDLIDLLIELKNSQTDKQEQKIFDFKGDNLVAQAALFFNAGFETASTTISFTLYELAVSPEIQTRLRKEIKDGLEKHDGKITYDMVMSLPYLDMVVSETLRMYPSLPFLDRIVTADYKVPNSNLVLEKGTAVYFPMLGLHYDPAYFPNPQVFDPERFTEENKKTRKPFVYMPFGEGPHGCIGNRFGLLESKLGIIHIILNHELSPCKETPIPMKLNPKAFLTAAEGGLYLNIRKISD